MKKIVYYLCAAAAIGLSGCQDEITENSVIPAKTGDEIMFGSELADMRTRTIYDDTPTKGPDDNYYYRVRWDDDDQIAIYCPEAAQTKLVHYKVTPNPEDSTTSSTVTKVNTEEAGLQWGTADIHHFYGFYPASRVTGTEQGHIRGTVPTTQNPETWNVQSNSKNGTNYYGKTNTDNSYMWAYGAFDRTQMGDQDVPLTFHPWMTVLEIKIPGPKQGEKTVTNVNVRAIDGTQTAIAGDFICDMSGTISSNGVTAPTYQSVSSGQVNNQISISAAKDGNFITLGANDTLIVRAYLLPIDDQNATDARNIQIRVATLNGAVLTRTLGFSLATANSIVPHKVNRVILPRLTDTGTNYWMSSLDNRIYLSELSIPGSKFSYLTEANGANTVYQGSDIKTQFLDGVRAFIVQTKAKATYDTSGSRWNPSYNYSSGTLNIAGINNSSTTIENTIQDIISELKTAEQQLGSNNLECAVVMLTYDSGSATNSSGDDITSSFGGSESVWIDVIQHELARLAKAYPGRIYTDKITPNTTLGDVKGKIIFKVNTNSQETDNSIDKDATIPALFTRWVKTPTERTTDMRWGSPNEKTTANLKWMYHEATHVGYNTEITWDDKKEQVLDVLSKSVDAYQQNDAHDTWYMVDAGGTYYYGSESNQLVIDLTNALNPIVFEALQTRTQNAATGLVFFNFADKQTNYGMKYGTAEMIQTIIDNNFKFNLRIRE